MPDIAMSWINGEWSTSATIATSINPANGEVVGQALITILLTVGADHILFASDYPYDMSTDAAHWIERAPISENDRRKICYDNAAALFGLSSTKS